MIVMWSDGSCATTLELCPQCQTIYTWKKITRGRQQFGQALKCEKKKIMDFEQTGWALIKEKLSALDTLDENRFQILGDLYHKRGMGLGPYKRLYLLGPT